MKHLLLTLGLILSCSIASAQSRNNFWSGGFDFTKKAAARENTRWSLSEWMAMKERNRMMDTWLSMNAPSPYEFSVTIPYKTFKTENQTAGTESSHSSIGGEFAAYAQFFGLSAEYENNSEEKISDLAGMLNIRLLGNSLQNTNLTLSIGQRTRKITVSGSDVNLNQQFGQASLDLHFTKYVGLSGKYRQYLKKDDSSYGNEIQDELTEAGIFIDFKALRVFGSWYQEKEKYNDVNTSAEQKNQRTGIKSGIRLFF